MSTDKDNVNKDDVLKPFTNTPYITLGNEVEQNIKQIATVRDQQHRGAKQTTHSGIADTTNSHYVGLCGEVAVSIYYDIPFETRTNLLNGDDGNDFTVYYKPQHQIGTLDVKTIQYNGGDLLIPTRKAQADSYFLCELRGAHVGLIGTATKEMVLHAHIEREKFPEQCYQIPRDELNPIPKRNNIISVNDIVE